MENKDSNKVKKKALRKTDVSGSISVRHQYSGNGSTDFWNIVNNIKNKTDRQELYSLGVALQNMEDYVLSQLQNIKKSYVHKWRGWKYYRGKKNYR